MPALKLKVRLAKTSCDRCAGGEFSPIHQISTDRIRWDSAAQLVQLLDGPLPDWQIHRQPLVSTADRIQDPTEESRSEPSSTASEWCYVDSAHQQVGPVPEQVIREMLQDETTIPKVARFQAGRDTVGAGRLNIPSSRDSPDPDLRDCLPLSRRPLS